MPPTIAIDAMGGDLGIEATVPASLHALSANPNLELILVGKEHELKTALARHGAEKAPRLRCLYASETIDMDDDMGVALRVKKQSSMRKCVELVKSKEACACVSSGNTGALLAISRYILRTLTGIDRPAIVTALPNQRSKTYMLDLGANIDCKAENLFQFAVMGSVLCASVDHNPKPSVGLLNVGKEAIKGSDQVKQADQQLREASLNYIGFVEGTQIFDGSVDVVVTDGFTGNISLKSAEGVGELILSEISRILNRNLWTKLHGMGMRSLLKPIKNSLDPRGYNGASLLGLQGIVIKSHGNADAYAFEKAIDIACAQSDARIPDLIDEKLEAILSG